MFLGYVHTFRLTNYHYLIFREKYIFEIKIKKFNMKVIIFAIKIGDEDILYP